MTLQRFTFFLIVSASASVPAHAAVYEFTVGGTVTRSHWPDVNVGDPITIRYTVDVQDRSVSPSFGSFAASQPSLTLPNTTIDVPGYVNGLQVYLDTRGDRFRYVSIVDEGIDFQIDLDFPAGTFQSDAVPLTLPLTSATFNLAFLETDSGDGISGPVTAYSAVEIPEPAAFASSLTCAALLSRRRVQRDQPDQIS